MVGETWTRDRWDHVEGDVLIACSQTVNDCEQEINEGGYFPDDDVRRLNMSDDLYEGVMLQIQRDLQAGNIAVVKVAPWYAVAQRMTFTITVTRNED